MHFILGLICDTMTPRYRSLFCWRYRDLIYPDDDTTTINISKCLSLYCTCEMCWKQHQTLFPISLGPQWPSGWTGLPFNHWHLSPSCGFESKTWQCCGSVGIYDPSYWTGCKAQFLTLAKSQSFMYCYLSDGQFSARIFPWKFVVAPKQKISHLLFADIGQYVALCISYLTKYTW